MKTTDDIIDELRLAATSDPAPAGLSGLLTEAADRLDNLLASGVHTCHANCQRPMCVLRRKLKAAQAELAQAQESLASSRSAHDAVVKASQDEHQELVERRIAASKHSNEYNEQFFRAAKMVSATPAKHCEDCAPEFGCWDGGESCYKQPLQSSTPAKHPDTVRLDWLEEAPSERLAEVRRILWQQRDTCTVVRAAIDAAHKQGGSHD